MLDRKLNSIKATLKLSHFYVNEGEIRTLVKIIDDLNQDCSIMKEALEWYKNQESRKLALMTSDYELLLGQVATEALNKLEERRNRDGY
jgi:hypothetical protein